MSKYYYLPNDNDVKGPHHISVLDAMVKAQEISPQCLICSEGSEDWIELSSLTDSPAEAGIPAPPINTFRSKVDEFISKQIAVRTDNRVHALCFNREIVDETDPTKVDGLRIAVIDPATKHIAPTILELEGANPYPIPLLIADTTMLRGLENGIFISEHHIFWRNQMEPAGCLAIKDLYKVDFKSGILGPTITVNDQKIQGGLINKKSVEAISQILLYMNKLTKESI